MCHTAEIWFRYRICRSTKLPSYNNLMQLDVDIICWLWTHRLCLLMCDVVFCRWLAGWNTTALLFLLRTSYCWTTSFSSPSMEPTKVQSEGGLNVTLTIRLLMHGKVSEHSDWVLYWLLGSLKSERHAEGFISSFQDPFSDESGASFYMASLPKPFIWF